MKTCIFILANLLFCIEMGAALAGAQENGAPHLEKRGAATQLIVDGKPFLMLSGELHNSTSSNLEYMKPIWAKLAAIGLNSVVTPLSWELVEPVEGQYDFTLVDGLIDQARQSHERIVFLWLASWKNGMSSYAPAWVKGDSKQFERVVVNGNEIEILSPLCDATREADARAFAALMRHIKEVDGTQHTVVMMQVENEVGVLGDSRDHSAAADKAFAGQVPVQLTAYLNAHREELYPDLRELWDAHGAKAAGTWTEVFGDGERADEVFMAWQYARYIQAVAARGKAEYDIPMYVNTWLAGDDTPPGEYPSGGPEPRVQDVGGRLVRRWIYTHRICMARTLWSGAGAIIAMGIRYICRKRAVARQVRPMCSMRWAKMRGLGFHRSQLSRRQMTPIRWERATKQLRQLRRCCWSTRARVTCMGLCWTMIGAQWISR